MERDNLAQSNTATYGLNSIFNARVVRFAVGLVKKLTSIILMLVFTVFGFIVLVVSVVLLTVESLISRVLSQAKTPKKERCDLIPNSSDNSGQCPTKGL